MASNVSDVRPIWISAALFIGCLLVVFLAPLATLLAGRLVPDLIVRAVFNAHMYLFPVEARRLPDLPSGIQAASGFHYELGILPVVIVWVVAALVFGWLTRGFKTSAVLGLAVLTIVLVAGAMQVVLHALGFRPHATLP
jgi:hypothetical protein